MVGILSRFLLGPGLFSGANLLLVLWEGNKSKNNFVTSNNHHQVRAITPPFWEFFDPTPFLRPLVGAKKLYDFTGLGDDLGGFFAHQDAVFFFWGQH